MSSKSPQDKDKKTSTSRGDTAAQHAKKAAKTSSSSKEDKAETSNKSKQNAKPEDHHKAEPWISEESISNLFDRLTDVTSSALKFAKKTTDTSYKVGKALIQSQDQLKLMVSAGQSLKDLREVAGLTASELSDALDLSDKSLIEAVENGTATLSFELILRLSALLARNDPIPFILKFSRTYSPETWKLLNDWGAGRLPLQYQREREFINIFRSQDQARQLSDEGFSKVLEFTRHAFNLSLHFIAEQEASLEQLKKETLESLSQSHHTQDENTSSPDKKSSTTSDTSKPSSSSQNNPEEN